MIAMVIFKVLAVELSHQLPQNASKIETDYPI
jgi:hypothetical protein